MADEEVTPQTGELLTANYGWTKPTVGASVDAWGGYLNTDLDGIDSTVKSVSNAIPAASSTTPAMDGTAAAGTGTTFARADHIHPTDTSRYAASNPSGYQTAAQVTTALGSYLPLTGGTLTGNLTINEAGDSYVFQQVSGVTKSYLQWQSSTNIIQLINAVAGIGLQINASGFFQIGSSVAYKTGGGPWDTTSDARIKTVESEYTQGLEEVIKLNPVVYTYKGNDAQTADSSPTHKRAADAQTPFVGLIAQEVEPTFPEMVSKREGYIDGVKVDDLRDLNTGPLIFALVNAVKTLAARVADLEAVHTSSPAVEGEAHG